MQNPPSHPLAPSLTVGRTYTLEREGRVSYRTVLALGPQSRIAPHKQPTVNGAGDADGVREEPGEMWVLYRTVVLSPTPRKRGRRTELEVVRSCSATAFKRWVVGWI